MFLPANGNLEKKRKHEILPSSLDQALQIKIWNPRFIKNSYPLRASASFPRTLPSGSIVSGVSQQVSSWSPESTEEEKIIFPLLYSECLIETPFSLRHFVNG